MEQLTSEALSDGRKILCHKAWVPPPTGYWKLNFASYAVSNFSNVAGVGCLVRDENGVYVTGFTKPIHNIDFDVIDLLAFCRSLYFAQLWGLDYIEIEGDCLHVYSLLLNFTLPDNEEIATILDDCRCLLEHFKGIGFRVVHESENEAATMLATIATSTTKKVTWNKDPPPPLIPILNHDVIGRYYEIPW